MSNLQICHCGTIGILLLASISQNKCQPCSVLLYMGLFTLPFYSELYKCMPQLQCSFDLFLLPFFFFTFLMKKLICTIWNIFSFCWLFQWRHSAKSLYSMLGLTRHVLLLSTSSLVLMGIFQLWCLQQSSSGNLHQSLVLFLRLLLLPRASATSKHQPE